MDAMQLSEQNRRRTCAVRTLWPFLLLGAACSADITGGIDEPSGGESQVVAGSAAGAAGASASLGRNNVPAGSLAVSTGAAGVGAATPDAMSGMRAAAAGAPTMAAAAGVAGAAGQQPQAGAGGSTTDGPGDPQMPDAPDPQLPDKPAMPDTTTTHADANELVPGGVRWLGRVDDRDPQAARFSWAGAGFAAVLKGTAISVRLSSESSSVFFQAIIDGQVQERFEVKLGDQVVTLASGLSDAPHKVEVFRDTEGDGPISVFHGFETGMLMGAPRGTGRFFEVIGDSVSAGYGSLGSEGHGSNAGPGCGANPKNSSWFATYSAVAGRALDAEVSTLARSGFGMVRGYGQNTNVMPPLFDDTLAGSNNPAWSFEHKPQAVIINLGTNDWNGGDPGTSYETAYLKFVSDVRMRYPDAWILLTVGSSLEPDSARQCGTRLGNIVEARMKAGDEKIDSFDIGLQDSSMTGCGWHPNAAEHMRMGMVLAKELRERLDW